MLSAIVVSHNRREALARTLRELAAIGLFQAGEVIVADNASADGSAAMVRERFPGVRLLELSDNLGVEAYNLAAAEARGDTLLILDDDSWPDGDSLRTALATLDARPGLGAVALLPVHPRTNRAEWHHGAEPDAFPLMGCGNLVRADAWRELGGYEPTFFLYRNDTDLALRLLATGRGVAFNPEWVVWHDSPAARRKSERWLRLATRNWLWLCRRHGEGLTALTGMSLGVLAAMRHAGPSFRRVWTVLSGIYLGITQEPAPSDTPRTGLARLLAFRLGMDRRARDRR
ncbi:MAG: glycosyltransferase family 2 protein [Leptolyngbya sp. PLA1]|nr:glycosyltransferase family 2 protein [Leptolyngbya sp. PLA1]